MKPWRKDSSLFLLHFPGLCFLFCHPFISIEKKSSFCICSQYSNTGVKRNRTSTRVVLKNKENNSIILLRNTKITAQFCMFLFWIIDFLTEEPPHFHCVPFKFPKKKIRDPRNPYVTCICYQCDSHKKCSKTTCCTCDHSVIASRMCCSIISCFIIKYHNDHKCNHTLCMIYMRPKIHFKIVSIQSNKLNILHFKLVICVNPLLVLLPSYCAFSFLFEDKKVNFFND